MLRLAPGQPAEGALAGLLHIVIGGGVFHALVKGHGNVGPQVGLDLHALLRPHKDPPAVDVGGEGHPLLPDLPPAGQGEHLKAAAVGEDGAIPAHELMKSSHLPHHIVAGAQVQVIGVGELDLAADLLQVQGGHRPLDGGQGAHVHKDRGLGGAVGAGEHPPPGPALGFQQGKQGGFLLFQSVRESAWRRRRRRSGTSPSPPPHRPGARAPARPERRPA